MAEMSAAGGARHLGAPHEQAAVLVQLHVGTVDRVGEARPTGAGVELRVRGEQLGSTRRAAVHAVVVVVPIGVAKRRFGALLAGYPELFGRESLFTVLIISICPYVTLWLVTKVLPPWNDAIAHVKASENNSYPSHKMA